MSDEYTINELKERITYQIDELTLLDILGIDIHKLVDILEDYIIDDYEKVMEYLHD